MNIPMQFDVHKTDQKDYPWVCEVSAEGMDRQYHYGVEPLAAVLKAIARLEEQGHRVQVSEITRRAT